MTFFDYIVFGGLALFIFAGYVLFLFRAKKLNPRDYKKYTTKIQDTSQLNPSHSLLESHKLFILALRTLENKKNKTAAQIISTHKKRFSNQKKIWNYHRLRNQIAHEIEVSVTEKDAQIGRQAFIQALASLL